MYNAIQLQFLRSRADLELTGYVIRNSHIVELTDLELFIPKGNDLLHINHKLKEAKDVYHTTFYSACSNCNSDSVTFLRVGHNYTLRWSEVAGRRVS